MALKTTIKRNPGALALIMQQLDDAVGAAAEAGAMQLYENLDESTSTRTGEHYPGQPRRSSKPHEMPQRQEGTLQGMVDHGQIEPGKHWWGLAPEGPEEEGQAVGQEMGNPKGNLIARAPTLRTGMDSRTHQAMREAAARGARKG